MITDWSNEPRPHWFIPVPVSDDSEVCICGACGLAYEDHTDAVPPEVELTSAWEKREIDRLPGF